jgi:hypothetical protein
VRHGADDARREPDGVGGMGPRPGRQVPVYGDRGGEDVGGGCGVMSTAHRAGMERFLRLREGARERYSWDSVIAPMEGYRRKVRERR